MNSKQLLMNAQRLFIEDKIEECIIVFSEAIKKGEKTEIAYLSRGVAYLKILYHDKAIDDFSAAIKMNEQNARAHYFRGIVQMTNEDYKAAITDFDKAIELEPENVPAFIARGTAYAQLGNEDAAAGDIKTAIIFSENNGEMADTVGLWKTQLNDILLKKCSNQKTPTTILSDDEIENILYWSDQGKKYFPKEANT